MNIETFLKSKETYQKVLDTLRTYADIEDESKGFIAGGSVSNILFSLIYGGNAVVNDIDVYWQVKEDVKLKEEQWYPAVYVNEDGLEMVDDAYGRVFVSDSGSRMRVVKHSRKGIFNNIEYLYEEGKRYGVGIIKPKNLVILEGFDLNCCKSGIDLENGVIFYTQEFVEFLQTKQLKIVSPCAPIQTTIRLQKKMKDLDCFCDFVHEMRFLTVAAKHIHGGQMTKFIGPETYVKYEKYKDIVDKYFNVREPKNVDELPHTLREVYEKDGKRNPKIKLWIFEPIMNFDIVEGVNSLNELKRIWYLLYTHKKKSEQTKINKIFYKNAYLGNMTEDTWEFKEYKQGTYKQLVVNYGFGFDWDSPKEQEYVMVPRYVSNRFTYQMILSNKDYHKCNFDLKHVDTIDKFTNEHHNIKMILKLSKSLVEQYNIIKFIKSLAKKEGDWIIGILETLNWNRHDNVKKLDEETVLNILEKEKMFNNKKLVDKVDLKSFEFKNCVRELVTPLELKTEGSKMGHCVGGYAHSIESGRSRIFHVDCDGIGSTVEIGLPMKEKYDYHTSKMIKVLEAYQPEGLKNECFVVFDNETSEKVSINEFIYHTKQHHGRYPEKGNLKPTETNKKVVKSLVTYLNNNNLPNNYKINVNNFAKEEEIDIFV